MACSRLSKRKMITAFLPLCCTKAYMYSTLTPALARIWSTSPRPPGRSGTSTATTSVLPTVKPLAFRTSRALSYWSTDEAQDAEIGGVGQGQGPDVDPGFAQDPGDFGQPARLVFQKYRDLFDFHGIPSHSYGWSPKQSLGPSHCADVEPRSPGGSFAGEGAGAAFVTALYLKAAACR